MKLIILVQMTWRISALAFPLIIFAGWLVNTHFGLENRHDKFGDRLYDANSNCGPQYLIKPHYFRMKLSPIDSNVKGKKPAGDVSPRFRRDFMYVASSSDGSSTHVTDDTKCFKKCNNEWRQAFEKRFDISAVDFYDFPFHPKILIHANYLSYCELAEQQNQCFREKCNDPSADRIFSPSNFLCSFKRNQFVRTRPCFEETEPLTFLKCDQSCHKSAVIGVLRAMNQTARVRRATAASTIAESTSTVPSPSTEARTSSVSFVSTSVVSSTQSSKSTTIGVDLNVTASESTPSNFTTTVAAENTSTILTTTTSSDAGHTDVVPIFDNRDIIDTVPKSLEETTTNNNNRAETGKVFAKSEMDSYERELDLLCTFQECYKQCHESILKEICAPGLTDEAIDLITSFVNWHAADVHDWHVVTQNGAYLPPSCARLAASASSLPGATSGSSFIM